MVKGYSLVLFVKKNMVSGKSKVTFREVILYEIKMIFYVTMNCKKDNFDVYIKVTDRYL